MSLAALVWALRVPKSKTVDDSALRTLCILADYASDQYIAFPGMDLLEKDRGLSRATLYRHLKALHAEGLILPGPANVVAHIPANRRPKVWVVNAWGRGLMDETPGPSRGLTPQGVGVSSGATHKEEPRTYVESNTQVSPARAREERSSQVTEFPALECVHGEKAVTWVNPKSGRRAPRCPLCRHAGRFVMEVASHE